MPRRRPNIVIIMADDMGYSDIGCYGGEIETPSLDRLAREGVRFTQGYNNAKCAPTRATLLTGLYSQQAGCQDGPAKLVHCVTIAEVLREAGYRTFMTGKWHAEELPVERGFDRYYGLCDGCCNFFNPGEQRPGEPQPAEKRYPRKWALEDRVMQPYTPPDPNFYSTDAFTDYALRFLDQHRRDECPFFLYVAYTAPHYPLQAPPEDIAKFRGKYRVGWDAVRAERYKRMVAMGIIDPGWALAPRDARVAAWEHIGEREAWDLEDMPGGGKDLPWEDARNADLWDLKMAVYAAMVTRMDRNIGRILDKLDERGDTDNTLVLFLSDNGGCAETRNQTPDVPPDPVHSYRTVDSPWANAQNTPFRKYKRWDHEGGISTPLIARWPKHVEPGRLCHEVSHIIDLMPTCIELARADYPETHNGTDVLPMEGRSLVPALEGAERVREEPLFWQFGQSRAVRQGPWKLVQSRGEPWELYDIEADRTELHNLASEQPDLVHELSEAWEAWAERCGAPHW
ncbi:MAG TPA: arylsulfatase [Candidatus Hydrogenedentes bacterium]|nr:arylsulfatase [Candidatus Hydrogenedentota bacterium]